ncbi:MAG TPA: DoxX family membrane protein [Candidatus Paceibacterota bacterium]|jgi:hypothetical protein|nr:DoxX family membrane protein [Candidatus Paceibacterota bacterium]
MKSFIVRDFLQRLGPSSILVVFGVWEIIDPAYWASYLPGFAANFGHPEAQVVVHGCILAVLGLALLFNFHTRLAAILSTLVLLSIVFSLLLEGGWNEIVMRDISILISTSALMFPSIAGNGRAREAHEAAHDNL